jgi:hypothetical protein
MLRVYMNMAELDLGPKLLSTQFLIFYKVNLTHLVLFFFAPSKLDISGQAKFFMDITNI